MRLLISNKVESTMITINNESDAFPKENMVTGILPEKSYIDQTAVIDFGSTTSERVTAIAIVYQDLTNVKIQANATDSWGSPSFEQSITSSGQIVFIDQTYRFWRIKADNTGYVNYIYLGEYLQMPGVEENSMPQTITNDATVTSAGYQKQTTRGTTAKTQEFIFPGASQAEYDDFIDWWESDDRSNNCFIVQFEEDMTLFSPFLCKVAEASDFDRHTLAYEWRILVEEAK